MFRYIKEGDAQLEIRSTGMVTQGHRQKLWSPNISKLPLLCCSFMRSWREPAFFFFHLRTLWSLVVRKGSVGFGIADVPGGCSQGHL